MPDNPKSNKEEKTGNGKRRKIYSFHEIKNKNNTDKLEHSSNCLLGTTSYDAKSSGTQGINLGRELVTVSSYPNSVFTQLSPINGNLHEAWFQSAQNSYFRYGLPSAPLPMTPVFAGIMNRRKRRENRPRRQRTTFTSEQTLKLELEYGRTEYISRPRRYELAEVLDLSENQIKIWFQNRRAKEKRIEKAQQDQQLRSSAMNNPTTYGSTGSYPVLCDPCVWPYPPGTLNNVLVTSSMS